MNKDKLLRLINRITPSEIPSSDGEDMNGSATHKNNNTVIQIPSFMNYKGESFCLTEIADATYYTMNCLCKYLDALTYLAENHIADPQDSLFNDPKLGIEMKMMDTILFDTGKERQYNRKGSTNPKGSYFNTNYIRKLRRREFQPKRWIYTDLKGNFHYKNIESVSLEEVIRAFFVNLNMGKKTHEYSNDDLMNFIANNKLDKIAVAIRNNTRYFLDITDFSDIKNRFKDGIDALQLYKIPNKEHFKNFYCCEYEFQHKMDKGVFDYYRQSFGNTVEELSESETKTIPNKIQRISLKVIHALETHKPKMKVRNIKILFLIEKSDVMDAWFVGVENLKMWKLTAKAPNPTLMKKPTALENYSMVEKGSKSAPRKFREKRNLSTKNVRKKLRIFRKKDNISQNKTAGSYFGNNSAQRVDGSAISTYRRNNRSQGEVFTNPTPMKFQGGYIKPGVHNVSNIGFLSQTNKINNMTGYSKIPSGSFHHSSAANEREVHAPLEEINFKKSKRGGLNKSNIRRIIRNKNKMRIVNNLSNQRLSDNFDRGHGSQEIKRTIKEKNLSQKDTEGTGTVELFNTNSNQINILCDPSNKNVRRFGSRSKNYISKQKMSTKKRSSLAKNKRKKIVTNFNHNSSEYQDMRDQETLNAKFTNAAFDPKHQLSNNIDAQDVDLENLVIISKPQAIRSYYQYIKQQKEKTSTTDNFFTSSATNKISLKNHKRGSYMSKFTPNNNKSFGRIAKERNFFSNAFDPVEREKCLNH
ncbi:unnamed protein product [Moneuplotes crassus]|uniref:Uncharacterized protein n=1 Tax=Euplotes crassus TaxID=5936 RepID=A0AAD1Y5Z3_EUPCR|nr:unnamed protein product [Moneuplotes crassus]